MNDKPITILDLAKHRLGRDAVSGGDFEEAGLPILGGCCVCHATVGAFNACPSKSGYLKCKNGCIDNDGFLTVEEANKEIFG